MLPGLPLCPVFVKHSSQSGLLPVPQTYPVLLYFSKQTKGKNGLHAAGSVVESRQAEQEA